MPTFSPGDIVRVPFPYTDRAVREHRPALVVSGPVGDEGALVWVLMITSADNRRWPGDIPLIEDHVACGLPAPSLIRTSKIMTIEAREAERRGAIGLEQLTEVNAAMVDYLDW